MNFTLTTYRSFHCSLQKHLLYMEYFMCRNKSEKSCTLFNAEYLQIRNAFNSTLCMLRM